MASAQYGRSEYWEERYLHKKETYDWYHHWDGIKDIITQFILPTHNILHAGCGTSSLPFEMQAAGYSKIVNMDNSNILIEDMKQANEAGTMQWDHKDIRTMNYPDKSFDVVLEKGLLDSVLCGDRSRIMSQRMLSQIYRVLVDGGVYISVTHSPPEIRKSYFDERYWAVKDFKISMMRISSLKTDDEKIHYVYVCSKR
ncbi:hypothetical protein SteCoe_11075 [Stentor coeruleus]|uniref:Methyltransferase type 11 domain-containing protein n=1 Tax=Stentor coeruleus TaxID=5963 RepID=A0A1R2CE06_9CILI|nr:hypothetical protein SteCoe_11075 [Stentor coeruleus]